MIRAAVKGAGGEPTGDASRTLEAFRCGGLRRGREELIDTLANEVGNRPSCRSRDPAQGGELAFCELDLSPNHTIMIG